MNRSKSQPWTMGVITLLCVTLLGIALPQSSGCLCAECREGNDCMAVGAEDAGSHCEMEQPSASCCGTTDERAPFEGVPQTSSHECQCHLTSDLPVTPVSIPPAAESGSPSGQHLISLITLVPPVDAISIPDLGMGERAPPRVLALDPEGGSLSIQLCIART